MDVDRCICCGAPVPEGRQVCWQCEHPKPCPCDRCQRDADCTGSSTNYAIGCASFDRWFRYSWRWMRRLFAPKQNRRVFRYYHPDELRGGKN